MYFVPKRKVTPLILAKFGQNNASYSGDEKFRSLFYIYPCGDKFVLVATEQELTGTLKYTLVMDALLQS